MKTITIIFCLLSYLSITAQNPDVIASRGLNQTVPPDEKELLKTVDYYKDDVRELKENLKSTNKYIFNEKMLNILFAQEIATYFKGGSDLSLQKFSATLDADETSLAFNVNFDLRKKSKLKKLSWLISTGYKAKATEKFATFVKNGKLKNSELGLTGKITYIGYGTVNFNTKKDDDGKDVLNREEIMYNYRESLYTKYTDKIKADGFKKEEDSLTILYDPKYNSENKDAKKKEAIKEKYESYYEKLATEEINFMKKNKLYKSLTDYWFSFDYFVPIGEKEYKYSPNPASNPAFKKTNFYPLKLTTTGTWMRKWSNGKSVYLSGQVSAYNNNNILINSDLETTPFQTVTIQSPTQQVVTESNDVYLIDFDRFITAAFRAETIYFIKDWVGVSPAVEKNMGQVYHNFNWKLGIPFSLKDKDGKPSINFELQWKEYNDNHYVGVNASFLFGKFLK